MECLSLIDECHKRENGEISTSPSNRETFFILGIIFLKALLAFVSQDQCSGVVVREVA